MKRYIWNILISIDQLCNAILGGYPDETMSSRMGKHVAKKDSYERYNKSEPRLR